MAEMSKDMKRRVEHMTRDIEAKMPLKEVVLRCMGETLLDSTVWMTATQYDRERLFVEEMQTALDALDYIIKRVWPAE